MNIRLRKMCVWMGLCTHLSTIQAQVSVPPPVSPGIEVFTNSSIYLIGTEGVKVYYLDGLSQLEAQLSQGLPTDSHRAALIAQQRAKAMGSALQQRAMNSAEGLTRAAHYGVNRVPAIVFDGKAIIYGINDVHRARQIYQRSLSAQGVFLKEIAP